VERKTGEYLGIYRVLTVDHGKVGLVDSHHNQVWLFAGQTVGGAPAASGGSSDSRPSAGTVVPSSAAPRPASNPVPGAPAAPRSTSPVAAGVRGSDTGEGGPLPLIRRLFAFNQ
jgi:hypothetical protein